MRLSLYRLCRVRPVARSCGASQQARAALHSAMHACVRTRAVFPKRSPTPLQCSILPQTRIQTPFLYAIVTNVKRMGNGKAERDAWRRGRCLAEGLSSAVKSAFH